MEDVLESLHGSRYRQQPISPLVSRQGQCKRCVCVCVSTTILTMNGMDYRLACIVWYLEHASEWLQQIVHLGPLVSHVCRVWLVRNFCLYCCIMQRLLTMDDGIGGAFT